MSDDVASWLERLELGAYAALFAEHDIDWQLAPIRGDASNFPADFRLRLEVKVVFGRGAAGESVAVRVVQRLDTTASMTFCIAPVRLQLPRTPLHALLSPTGPWRSTPCPRQAVVAARAIPASLHVHGRTRRLDISCQCCIAIHGPPVSSSC